MVGGMLSEPKFRICKAKSCSYTLKIKSKGVKVMNISNTVAEKVEKLSYETSGEIYERTYDRNSVTHYILMYTDLVEGLDFSITLRPSTANTGLYVNAKTKPLTLDSYDFIEKGKLAKRITVKWEYLKEMQATKSNMYIAVSLEQAGEFFIKIDAH